jgi:type IV fimbrial biogenesis protein FimT
VLIAFADRKSQGFSLVELMVGVIIVGILASLAMPSFKQMLRNFEVRNAAESIANGLQRARSEAVSRNTNVQFVLGAFPPDCSETGSSWVVSVVAPVLRVDSRCSSEGSRNVTVNAWKDDLATPATTITFNNFGGMVANVPASPSLAQVDVAADGASQNLRVTIQTGGAARMCDPGLAPGSSPRAC